MARLDILKKVLTKEERYWLFMNETGGIFLGRIPEGIKRGAKEEDLLYKDLKKLQNIWIENVYLNRPFAPFQNGVGFDTVVWADPISDDVDIHAFLKKALILESDDIWEYKKIFDELSEGKEKRLSNYFKSVGMEKKYFCCDECGESLSINKKTICRRCADGLRLRVKNHDHDIEMLKKKIEEGKNENDS